MRRALAVLLLLPAIARADPEEQLGLGLDAAALSGAVGAVGGTYSAVVYNPGALSLPTDRPGFGEVSASAQLMVPDLWTTLPASPGDLGAPNTYAYNFGARVDLGNGFGLRGLVLGASVYAPFNGLVQSTLRPDETPQWLMYADRTQHLVVHAALAYRITEWLSVGAGMRIIFDEETFLTGMATGVERVVDPMTGASRITAGTRIGVSTSIYGHVAPTAGVLVTPLSNLRFGFSWRGELLSNDWGWARLQGIEGIADLGFVFHFAHIYRPNQLALSAAWRIIPEIDVSAEVTWAMWSAAPSPNQAVLGTRFGDTIVPAVGVRLRPMSGLEVMLGYRYDRAPYSDLGGATNLLTCDSHTASWGARLDLDTLVDEPFPFGIGVAGRFTFLEDRDEEKNGRRFPDDHALVTNPGYPGYRYGGWIPSVQVQIDAHW